MTCGKQYDYYRPQLTCVLLVHITSTHKPSSDTTVGERSNFKKKILCTRKIMVMHSNERGECSPRTLVDHKRKRYDNVVDVVVRLHDRPILALKVWHLHDLHTFGSVMSHELMIQQSVKGELHRHDGVMTVMMLLPEQGFA